MYFNWIYMNTVKVRRCHGASDIKVAIGQRRRELHFVIKVHSPSVPLYVFAGHCMIIGTFRHGFKLLFSSRTAHLLFKIACATFPFDVWSIGHKICQYYHVFDIHVLNWLCCYLMKYVVGKIEVIISTWSKKHQWTQDLQHDVDNNFEILFAQLFGWKTRQTFSFVQE